MTYVPANLRGTKNQCSCILLEFASLSNRSPQATLEMDHSGQKHPRTRLLKNREHNLDRAANAKVVFKSVSFILSFQMAVTILGIKKNLVADTKNVSLRLALSQ